MATDITTLAIALQSKEAENSLKTFNELLVSGSKNAERMERLPIGVDVNAAMRELSAFKASYEDIAKTAGDIHFDIGMNMPTKLTPPPIEPSVDATALNELRAIFKQTNEEIQRETEGVSESISNMGSESERAAAAVRSSAESTAIAAQTAKEQSAAIRELAAAQKKMENAAMQVTQTEAKYSEASQRAAEIEKQKNALMEQRAALMAQEANSKQTGQNIDANRAKTIEAMAQQVMSLQQAYKQAQSEADRFASKLQVSAEKADEARARYELMKNAVNGTSAPAIEIPPVDTSSLDNLQATIRQNAADFQKQADIIMEAVRQLESGANESGTAVRTTGESIGQTAQSVSELKTSFQDSSEEIRKQSEIVTEAIKNIGSGTEHAGDGVRSVGEFAAEATESTNCYSDALQKLATAQKELEAATAKADAAGEKANEADRKAMQSKRELIAAQQELKRSQDELNAAPIKSGETANDSVARVETLQQEVNRLTEVYAKAQEEFKRYQSELAIAGEKEDELRAKYEAARMEVESFKMPNIPPVIIPAVEAPEVDTTALDELKSEFTETTDELREKTELVKETMETIGDSAGHAAETIRTSGDAMREMATSAEEYEAKLAEVNAAQAEMEKYAKRADAAALAASVADQRAVDAKHELVQANRALAQVTEEIDTARKSGSGNIDKLTAREAELREEIEKLKEAYRQARAEAEKFDQRNAFAGGMADEAAKRYRELRAELDAMPKPVEKTATAVNVFTKNAKLAGTTATKLARGFNSVAMMGGAAIPGLAGLGRAISMFAFSGPWVGGAIIGLGALSAAFKKLSGSSDKEAQYIHENAERALKSAQETKKFISESESDWNRLGELSGVGELTNAQNQEATAIIERLTEVYGELGIEIDATTGKLSGYAEARRKANEQEIEIQKEQLRFARLQAEKELKKQEEKVQESIKPGFLKGDQVAFKGMYESLEKSINDQNKAEIEIVKELNQNKERLQRIIDGEEKLTYQIEHTDFQGMKTYTEGTVSKDTARDQLKQVEELEKAWQKANEIKKEQESFNTKPAEEYSKEVGKLAKTLADSESKFTVDANGEKRLKTNEEVYQQQKKQIESLNSEIQRLQTGINYDNTQNIENITNLENEKLELIKETLAYENRVTDEKKRQSEANRKMIEAAQSLSDTNVNYFKQQGQKLQAMLSDKNASEEDIMDAFDRMIEKAEQIKTGKAIVSDYSEFEYRPEQKDFRGTANARFLGEIDRSSAEEYSNTLQKIKSDFESLNKEKNRLENLNTPDAEELYKQHKARLAEIASEIEKETAASLQHIDEMAVQENGKQAGAYLIELQTKRNNLLEKTLNYEKRLSDEQNKQAEADRKKIEAAQEQLKAAEAAYTLDKNAKNIRESNADEKAADRQKEINELKKQIKSLAASAMRRDATSEDLLEWGKRYNPETGKMNGAQKQAGWRGVLSDRKGGVMTEVSVGTEIAGKEVEIPLIIPESTESDLVRIAKIANGEMTKIPDDLMEKAVDFAKKRLAEGKSPFFNGDKEDEVLRNVSVNAENFAKLAEAQSKLLKLQAEQGKYTDAVQEAQKANADKFKDYLFDKSGAVGRKKTDAELRDTRKKQLKDEIQEARKRLATTEKGTLEYENARAKLTDLEIESYNLRKKTNAATVMQNARTENTRMVRGIEARSSEALALESRMFRRDDSEKAILKDTKDVQTDIKDIVSKMFESMTNFETIFNNIGDTLQPL